jgi:hypothetical protein
LSILPPSMAGVRLPLLLLSSLMMSAYKGRRALQMSVVVLLPPLPLASDDITAIAVALASTVTITAAAANVTTAIDIATAATTATTVVTDAQQHQWGGWSMSAARGGDDNGDNDDHSVAAAALAEYPDLWHTNLYGGGGDGLVPSLGLSPGQYASLLGNLPVVGDGLYHGGGGGGNRLQDNHWAFAVAVNTTLQGLLCYATINIKERRWNGGATSHLVASAQQCSGWQQLRNNQHKREEAKMRLSSWQEVVAQWINWWRQLCNGQGGSDKDNSNTNGNDDTETTKTALTTTTAAVSIGINAGTDTTAAHCQGSTMQGKCSRRKRWRQHLMSTGIGASQQQWHGQCCHAGGRTAWQEPVAEGTTRARVEKYSYQQEQMAEQKLLQRVWGGGVKQGCPWVW